jgi:HprK-related kinase B
VGSRDGLTARFRFNDFTVLVTSDDPRLVARLSTYYRQFSVDGGSSGNELTVHASMASEAPPKIELTPWGTKGKESFADVAGRRIIRKDRTGSLIDLGGTRWRIAGDLQREFSQLLNLICAGYGVWQLDRSDGAMFHASAAVSGGQAIAIVGQSGAGKSSVTVRLLEHGFDYLTNDRLIVESRRGRTFAHGLPKLPRVNPGTLLASERTRKLVDAGLQEEYARLKPEQLWAVENKHDLDVSEALQRRWLLSAPLSCLLILHWRGESGPQFQRLNADAAVEELRAAAKSFGPFDRKLSKRSDRAVLALAQQVPVYRVSGRTDPSGLAAEIARRGLEELGDAASRRRRAPQGSSGGSHRSGRTGRAARRPRGPR